jgi:hypothetical protein
MNRPDGKEAKVVMEQTANDVDYLKRSSSPGSSEPTTELHTVMHHFRKPIARQCLRLAVSIGSINEP